MESLGIETVRLSGERAGEVQSTLDAVVDQSVRANVMEAQNAGSSLEVQRTTVFQSITEQEMQLVTARLGEALHANRSLRASWSWRMTAPLRLALDAIRVLRLCPARLPRKERLRGLAQWLFFRRCVLQSGVFDEDFYLKRYPDVARMQISPVFHFFVFGSAEGRQPHFLFNTEYYRAQNAQVAELHVNPLVHYLKWGGQQGRNPHPDFDSAFYLQQNPDVQAMGLNPLAHYLGPGTAEGRDPNSWFRTSVYLDEHPYVAVVGENPLIHYLTSRRRAVHIDKF